MDGWRQSRAHRLGDRRRTGGPSGDGCNLAYGKDEIDFAGGLKGEPVDLVRAKSIDLLVPANSEIVIEGEVRPGELEDEGPFGEFAGIMGAVAKRPVAHITAITYRTRPLF